MKNLFKKIFVTLCIISVAAFSTAINLNDVYAEGESGRQFGSCETVFLGFETWDCNVKKDPKSETELKENIWQIVLNISKNITVLAGYLILGFVIYGGYQYTFSGGDATKIAKGKKTLANAFIGLAIVMSAHVILGGIRFGFMNGANGCIHNGTCNPGDMVSGMISWVIGIAGLVSAIFLVYGGVQYMTSAGDATKAQKARNTILYAVIGLIIVALSSVISAFVANMINDANNQTSFYLNQTTISKEVNK